MPASLSPSPKQMNYGFNVSSPPLPHLHFLSISHVWAVFPPVLSHLSSLCLLQYLPWIQKPCPETSCRTWLASLFKAFSSKIHNYYSFYAMTLPPPNSWPWVPGHPLWAQNPQASTFCKTQSAAFLFIINRQIFSLLQLYGEQEKVIYMFKTQPESHYAYTKHKIYILNPIMFDFQTISWAVGPQ